MAEETPVAAADAGEDAAVPAYAVTVDSFSGPLDLLLYLVRRTELDITEIPISEIADQFVDTVRGWQAGGELDLELAGDFVLMASTLLEIKARAVAPPPVDPEAEGGEDEDDLVDPRADLIAKLLAYRRFKEATAHLQRLEDARAERSLRRLREEIPEDPEEVDGLDLGELDPHALFSAWQTIVQRLGGMGPRTVARDDIPIESRISGVIDYGRQAGRTTLRQLLAHEPTALGRITTVMATLEVVRQRWLEARQWEQYGEVELRFRPPEERDAKPVLPEPEVEEPKRRRRRPPLATFTAPVSEPAEAPEPASEAEEPFESDEERFLRELNEACALDRVLDEAKDWEGNFRRHWEVLHPPPPPPPAPEPVIAVEQAAPAVPAAVEPAADPPAPAAVAEAVGLSAVPMAVAAAEAPPEAPPVAVAAPPPAVAVLSAVAAEAPSVAAGAVPPDEHAAESAPAPSEASVSGPTPAKPPDLPVPAAVAATEVSAVAAEVPVAAAEASPVPAETPVAPLDAVRISDHAAAPAVATTEIPAPPPVAEVREAAELPAVAAAAEPVPLDHADPAQEPPAAPTCSVEPMQPAPVAPVFPEPPAIASPAAMDVPPSAIAVADPTEAAPVRADEGRLEAVPDAAAPVATVMMMEPSRSEVPVTMAACDDPPVAADLPVAAPADHGEVEAQVEPSAMLASAAEQSVAMPVETIRQEAMEAPQEGLAARDATGFRIEMAVVEAPPLPPETAPVLSPVLSPVLCAPPDAVVPVAVAGEVVAAEAPVDVAAAPVVAADPPPLAPVWPEEDEAADPFDALADAGPVGDALPAVPAVPAVPVIEDPVPQTAVAAAPAEPASAAPVTPAVAPVTPAVVLQADPVAMPLAPPSANARPSAWPMLIALGSALGVVSAWWLLRQPDLPRQPWSAPLPTMAAPASAAVSTPLAADAAAGSVAILPVVDLADLGGREWLMAPSPVVVPWDAFRPEPPPPPPLTGLGLGGVAAELIELGRPGGWCWALSLPPQVVAAPVCAVPAEAFLPEPVPMEEPAPGADAPPALDRLADPGWQPPGVAVFARLDGWRWWIAGDQRARNQ